jgi:histidinol-phosphate aminotransferase
MRTAPPFTSAWRRRDGGVRMKGPRPRPDLEGLQPYSSSDTTAGRIFLHANENPYPLPQEVMDEIVEATAALELNRYPAPKADEVIEELASYVGVDPSWLWIGDGSNEVLLQSCLAFGGPGRTALLFEPTYRMHYRQARMAGTAVEVAPRRADYSIDLDTALAVIGATQPDIVFVCSPNNPTGTMTPPEDILAIARATNGLVVADEAYFEFCGATVVPRLIEHPNVIVARTLSKAFRFAGVRVGYGVAAPGLLESLNSVRMPYAQSSFAQAASAIVIRHREKVLEAVPSIVAERERVSQRLAEVPGVEVFASGANFVFFRHPRAASLLEGLAERGIVVRDFTHLEGCENCLRVTAGRPEENDEFLEVTATLA